MKWHKSVGLLVVVMLAIGSFTVFSVPVARGGTVNVATVPVQSVYNVQFASANSDFGSGSGMHPSGYYEIDGVRSTYTGAEIAKMNTAHTAISCTWITNSPSNGSHTMLIAIAAGYSSYIVNWAWFGSVSILNGNIASAQTIVPLSMVLTGPAAIDLVDGGTWTATPSGGTSPYTYTWVWGKQAPYWSGSVVHGTSASDDLVKVLTAGNWTVQCTVTDDDGGSVMHNMAVTAAVIAGAYTVHFARSGGHGEYVDVYVLDSGGVPVTITGSANTEYGQFGADGLFGWNAANDEAFQSGSIPGFSGYYVWRYDMSSTVDLVTFAPNADFWLHSWLHLAVSNLDIEIMHHWNSTLELAGQHWYNENGDSVGAEVPPGATVPEVPEAYQWLWNWILKIFSYVFVPTTAQVQEMAVSISDSSFNPFNNADGTPVSWPAAVDSITLLQHENIGTSEDVIIPLEDNSVFATVRLGVKFAISFSVVMLILGAL